MSAAILVMILVSHACAARPFLSALKTGRSPRPADFAIISFILFYDVGMVLSWAGMTSGSPHFQALLEGSSASIGSLVLILAPWILRLGASLTKSGPARDYRWPAISNHSLFVAASLTVSIALAVAGLRLSGSADIWLARRSIGGQLGNRIILLYIPLYLLGYYVTTQQARTRRGLIHCLTLATCSACATLPIGQRTTVLLPFVIIGLFRSKLRVSRGIGVLLVGLTLATALLPAFKFGYAENFSRNQLVDRIIVGDISRDGVLSTALEASELIGTKVLPYSGAGYIYNLFFFVPRALAPFKGQPTAIHFTAWLVGGRPEDMGWGFGIGMVEEIILNFGLLFLPVGLLTYGIALGGLLRVTDKFPALRVPTNLGAVWLCGYHLRAILMLFGAMAVVALSLEWIFRRKRLWSGVLIRSRQIVPSEKNPLP